jgi:hypothetical protein
LHTQLDSWTVMPSPRAFLIWSRCAGEKPRNSPMIWPPWSAFTIGAPLIDTARKPSR